jgi:hypothetical protein
MKSERRHELQHNALLEWLVETGQTVRPYGNAIMMAVAVVVILFAVWLWWSGQSAVDRDTAWGTLFAAQLSGDPSKVSDVADKYPGSPAGQWAAIAAGDMYLSNGCDQLFQNKATATDELNKAVESFKKVQNSDNPLVCERATYGLARTYEALSGTRQAELDKAIEAYKKIVEGKGVFANAAQQRLDDLDRSATKQFYDQFAKYDPKPAFTDEAGKPGDTLHFDPNALPQPEPLPKPSSDAPASGAATPPAETPAAPEQPAVPAAPPVNQ